MYILKFIKKYKVSIFVVLISFLFMALPVYKATKVDYLFAADPWEHLYLVEHGESEKLYSQTVSLYDGKINVHYPSLMRTMIYLITKHTGISSFEIFKYSGFVTRLILAFLIYFYCFRYIKSDNKIKILLPFLVFSNYYFLYRSWITFPENYVLIFHLITLILTTELLISKSKQYLLFILLSVNTALTIYFHRPSFIVTGVMLFSFSILYLYKNKFSKHSLILFFSHVIFTILLCLPVMRGLIYEYISQFESNVGTNAIYSRVAQGMSQYTNPTLSTYISFSSNIIVIFFVIGIFSSFVNISLRSSQLFIYCIFTLFLSLSNYFNIYLPTDRMQGFFMIPITLISYIGLVFVFNILFVNNNLLNTLTILFLIFTTFTNVIYSDGWFSLWHGESETGRYINSYLMNNQNNLIFLNNVVGAAQLRISNPLMITTNIDIANLVISSDDLSQNEKLSLLKTFGYYKIYLQGEN